MNAAQAAECRALAVEMREKADQLDARLAAAGWPTSAAMAEVFAFPAGRRDRYGAPSAGRCAEVVELRAGGAR